MNTFPAPTEAEPVDLGNGVTAQWLHHGAIIYYHLSGVERQAIDAWLEGMRQAIEHFPAGEPVLLLHELPELPITPYFRERSQVIVEEVRDKHTGRVSILLPETAFARIVQNFLQRDLQKVSQSFERRVFSDRAAAIDWLLEIAPKVAT